MTQPPKNPLMSGRQERKRISSHRDFVRCSKLLAAWKSVVSEVEAPRVEEDTVDLLGGIDVGCGSIGEESFGYFKWFEWGCKFWRLFRAFVGCLTWWGPYVV